jgi:hypothetical protein
MEIRNNGLQTMRFSKEKIEEIKNQVRSCLARNPKASCREIAKIVNHDPKFINFLKNEIHLELSRAIAKECFSEEIAKFELLIIETSNHLWEILDNPLAESGEKISAVKTLIGNYSLLLEKKIASGLLAQAPPPKMMTLEEAVINARETIKVANKIRGVENEMRERGMKVPTEDDIIT